MLRFLLFTLFLGNKNIYSSKVKYFSRHYKFNLNLKHQAFFLVMAFWINSTACFATDYYFHPTKGNDKNMGTSISKPFASLAKVAQLDLKAGDRILLAKGETFKESLLLIEVVGNHDAPIIIDSFNAGNNKEALPHIDSKGFEYGVLVENSSYVHIQNVKISASGLGEKEADGNMRVGVMLRVNGANYSKGITLKNLTISDVFFENKGFKRGADEVRTANGTQKYGWGIRVMSNKGTGTIENVSILDCSISNVAHTGIKLTGGDGQNIRNVNIYGNEVTKTGGPGIQMSRVKFVHVKNNEVSYSGSDDDSRKWGRGSGLWTWGSSMVMIEHNKFMYANGPGDSAGAHIDFNCDNVILQYNLSAYNAGGFCEILGNNYNCAYRFNVSVNDGHRIKGQNGAFQEGKVFWLSGYQGKDKPRKGPVNAYFYNNTIYTSDSLIAKVAVGNRSSGVLVANNIFHLSGGVALVKGDQYKPEGKEKGMVADVFFENNIFSDGASWPSNASIKSGKSIKGNARFKNPGGLAIEDYTPLNQELVSNGINIPFLPNDDFGLTQGLNLKTDILGNNISATPFIGAIKPSTEDN